ncbi:MAG TPA: histidine kinase [Ktedonobacterales bacterium]|jgi:two-component system sensor histidine kinase DesK
MNRRVGWLTKGYRRWKDFLLGLEGAEESIASSGISFQLWRLYQHFWLLCLVFPIAALIQSPPSIVQMYLALAGLVGYTACYTWLMWPHPASRGARHRRQPRLSLLLLALLLLLVLVLSLSSGRAFLWLFMGVSASASVLLPVQAALLSMVVLMVLPVLISITMAGGLASVDWLYLLPLLLLIRALGLDLLGGARLFRVIGELQAARRELARLAVMEERLRVARDLHDLLGHTFSMIALKSELARRVLAQDPRRAEQELHEVEAVARQTLREVREAVAGYRQPTLRLALEGAEQVLEAAGIAHQVECPALPFPAGLDAALAWVVREGVTNVVRHSRARWCRIRVTQAPDVVCAEVTNDDRSSFRDAGSLLPPFGHGLRGMAERAALLGGHLEAGLSHSGGAAVYRLQVKLPLVTSKAPENGALPIRAQRTAGGEATT